MTTTKVRALLAIMAVLLAAAAAVIILQFRAAPPKTTYYPAGPTKVIGVSPSPRCSKGQADIPGVSC